MRQAVETLSLTTHGQGLVPITHAVSTWVHKAGIQTGLLTLWCQHTSASLVIQENADPTVRQDIQDFFASLVPEGAHYRHDLEGPDDMPAHIRAVLTQVQLSIPVSGGTPLLGTWQGVYLFEHRRHTQQRRVVMHLMGE